VCPFHGTYLCNVQEQNFFIEKTFLKSFSALSPDELYAILSARNAVFVVEQQCVYQDADGYDQQALHLVIPHEGLLGAYCRILLPGAKYPEWSIGRVLTVDSARGKGLGHTLMQQALEAIASHGGGAVRISAQAYLQRFYEHHGFVRVSEPYLEDNIPHIEMLRQS
jgi:ElaA protein